MNMQLYDEPVHDPEILERAQVTFDLCEAAEQIMRQNIRRRNPSLSEPDVEERLIEWRLQRPDAPFGDAYVRPSKKWARKFGLEPCPPSARPARAPG